MLEAFSSAIDTMFEQLGEDAAYTPVGGGPTVTVRIIPAAPTAGSGRSTPAGYLIQPEANFQVRKSEVALPAIGDLIEHDGAVHRVQSDPEPHALKSVWLLDAPPRADLDV